MKKPTVVLFDVGNVIIQADHAVTHDLLESLGVAPYNARYFYESEEYGAFSRGHLTARQFHQRLVTTYFHVPLSYHELERTHHQHIFCVDPGVVEVLNELTSVRLGFLTDTNEWQTDRERELIRLENYGSDIFRSHEMSMLKVDPGTFPRVVAELGAEASEVLLIDDSPEKIAKAKVYGLQTLLFKDSQQLRPDLFGVMGS
jgi:glucose-1-phosphatase